MSHLDLEKVDTALQNCLLASIDLCSVRDTLVAVAREAGQMILAADTSLDISETKRNTSDRVTATDKAVEAMVHSRLTADYPAFSFLGEESFKEGQLLKDAPTFVCDPIDGTLNFIHGFPNIAVSLALTIAKKPVVGVVFNPFRGDLFTAIKGQGSFLERANGTICKLPPNPHPTPLSSLNDCLIAIEWGNERYGQNWDLRTEMAKMLMSRASDGGAMCHSVRSSGSSALDFCYVAAGWIDLYWEGGVWIWDICAGWLIVEEAGGLVAGANPDDWDPTLEGRTYLAVRPTPSGQKEVVEELWGLMGGRKFVFG